MKVNAIRKFVFMMGLLVIIYHNIITWLELLVKEDVKIVCNFKRIARSEYACPASLSASAEWFPLRSNEPYCLIKTSTLDVRPVRRSLGEGGC
jgi:hypothetical protein